MQRIWFGAFAFAALACGGSGATSTSNETTSADEARPVGPPPSFLADGTKVTLRMDFSRARRSPAAPDVDSAIRASSAWQTLAGGSGLSPLTDFDAVVAGGDALYSERRVVVIRHPHSEAELRQRILALAVDRGRSPEWRDVEGYPAISWQAPSSLPYSLVITAAHELVLAPDDELPRIAAVARAQSAHRTHPDAIVEPHMIGLRPSELATAQIGVPLPAREGYPAPPARSSMEADQAEDGQVTIRARGEWDEPAQAAAAHEYLTSQIRYWSQQMIVRAIGMNRPLDNARVTAGETSVDLEISLTAEEIRRGLGLLALSQTR